MTRLDALRGLLAHPQGQDTIKPPKVRYDKPDKWKVRLIRRDLTLAYWTGHRKGRAS